MAQPHHDWVVEDRVHSDFCLLTTVFKEMVPKPETQTSSVFRQSCSFQGSHPGGKKRFYNSHFLCPFALNVEFFICWTSQGGEEQWGIKTEVLYQAVSASLGLFPPVILLLKSWRVLYLTRTLPLRLWTPALHNEGFLSIFTFFLKWRQECV